VTISAMRWPSGGVDVGSRSDQSCPHSRAHNLACGAPDPFGEALHGNIDLLAEPTKGRLQPRGRLRDLEDIRLRLGELFADDLCRVANLMVPSLGW
jgi:hypothetical protein